MTCIVCFVPMETSHNNPLSTWPDAAIACLGLTLGLLFGLVIIAITH